RRCARRSLAARKPSSATSPPGLPLEATTSPSTARKAPRSRESDWPQFLYHLTPALRWSCPVGRRRHQHQVLPLRSGPCSTRSTPQGSTSSANTPSTRLRLTSPGICQCSTPFTCHQSLRRSSPPRGTCLHLDWPRY